MDCGDLLDLVENLEHLELLVPWVHLDSKDVKDHLDLLEFLDPLDRQVGSILLCKLCLPGTCQQYRIYLFCENVLNNCQNIT